MTDPNETDEVIDALSAELRARVLSDTLNDEVVIEQIAWSLWAWRYNDDYHSWGRAEKSGWRKQARFIAKTVLEMDRVA